jgi:hypothetical protein
MSDYILSKPKILALALAKTDAGSILGGSTDWIEPRNFDRKEILKMRRAIFIDIEPYLL